MTDCIADLHIHSRYSRATSPSCDLPHLDLWARYKGIDLVGTGDFTHPQWQQQMEQMLVPGEDGLYSLKQEYALPAEIAGQVPNPRFVITGEISCIYKKKGKTRKVHHLILLPSLEAAQKLSQKLAAIGNLHSDGRPILKLDSRDLLEMMLEITPDGELIPAHIWTPHFSIFGAFSQFSSLEECFEDLTPYIHAVETGLSSDPPMNWPVSALEGIQLVSNSDAHSPQKLGREATVFEIPQTYSGLLKAIRTGSGLTETIEFFPEEGKYHLDGHRACQICCSPAQTREMNGICPVCGKKLTVGVLHRTEELSNQPLNQIPKTRKPFQRLIPLQEAAASCLGLSPQGKRAQAAYFDLIRQIGTEFYILRKAPLEELERTAGVKVAQGIERMRQGEVLVQAGYDGVYGTVSFTT